MRPVLFMVPLILFVFLFIFFSSSSEEEIPVSKEGVPRVGGGGGRRVERTCFEDGCVPNLVVIGAQKGGTSFLRDSLIGSGLFDEPRTAEAHYFDELAKEANKTGTAQKEPTLRAYSAKVVNKAPTDRLIFEKTPSYLPSPSAAVAAAKLLNPYNVTKYLALIKDPVARYFSAVRMWKRRHNEKFVTERDQRVLTECLRDAYTCLYQREGQCEPNFGECSRVWRGCYRPGLERWAAAVGSENLAVLRSEDFRVEPLGTVNRLLVWLGLDALPAMPHIDYVKSDAGAMEEDFPEWMYEALRHFYQSDLCRYDQHFEWEL
jgi:hypothetical protein